VIVVPDAGPLIYLAGAGKLDLLARLYDRVVVPLVVYEEIVVAGAGLVGAAEGLRRRVARGRGRRGRSHALRERSTGAKQPRFRCNESLLYI